MAPKYKSKDMNRVRKMINTGTRRGARPGFLPQFVKNLENKVVSSLSRHEGNTIANTSFHDCL